MKVRKILAFTLALCLIWCATITAAEKTQPEDTAADAVVQVKPGKGTKTGTEAEGEPAEPADEDTIQPGEEPTEPGEEPTEPGEEPADSAEEPDKPAEEPEESAQPAEEPAQPAADSAQSVEGPAQPAEEPTQPAEEPAQPAEDPTQSAEEPVQPAEEPTQPAEESTQPAEEPAQSAEEPTEPGEDATEPAEEPADPAEEPEQPEEGESVQPETVELPLPTEGSAIPGKTVTGTLADGSEEKIWELEVSFTSDLILTTEGLPVRVAILRVPDGEIQLEETAPEEGLMKDIRLLQGTYLICICSAKGYGGEFTWKLERKDETGTEPETSEDSKPVAGTEEDTDNTDAEPGESAELTDAEATEQTETEPSETDPEFTTENNPEEASGDDRDTVSKETETPVVSVRLHSNLQNGEETPLGTEVVIRAEVTGTDSPFHLQWQYSPDGGETIVNVDTDAGGEDRYLRYTLDETNIHYLWRAAVIFDEPEE